MGRGGQGHRTDRMQNDATATHVELEHIQLIFLERAIAAMRDVGMTDDQIDEALGRHDMEPPTLTLMPL